MRLYWPLVTMVLSAVLAVPATSLLGQAPQEAVHWHNDLESAKAVAKETGRLVLVHFWTPSCGPCMALNQNVFNQPGVANAIETQFVPVKLNADENTATATWYGINRVPTDVIITPEGQMVAKVISPPTPAAYVAEMTAAAGKHTSKGGQAFAKAAAAAPTQPQLNAAYANLQLSPNAAVAVDQQRLMQAQQPTTGSSASPGSSPVNVAENAFARGKQYREGAGASQNAAPNNFAAAPQVITNQSAFAPNQGNPSAVGAQAGAPNQIANPYIASTTSSPPIQQQSMPVVTPDQTTPVGANSTLPVGGPFASQSAAPGSYAKSNATPNVAGTPDLRQLPAGAPPLGFDGYCPVSMRNVWKWIPGDPRWGVVHRGRTYWFAGPEEQKQFWTDPDRYTPALSGMDPVLSIDHQQQVPGKREHSLDYDGLFYMFASEATLQQFTANPQKYATAARQAMGIPRGRLVR
jgi:YHS domain-containing protein/thiol-disulfide isomerase/thioredoxin